MGTEKLKFKLELYATMWDKPPHAEILVNDKSYFNNDITGTEDKPNVIEFEHEFDGRREKSNLIIKRSGKSNNQTVVNDNGDLLKDQLLHIKGIRDRRDRHRCIGVRGFIHAGISRTMGHTATRSRCGIARFIQERH